MISASKVFTTLGSSLNYSLYCTNKSVYPLLNEENKIGNQQFKTKKGDNDII